ncbi:hypothetical protein [uncultured Desulfuromonas sp.]|uniref:hypothetical protein n=1 Tax=uncultured Desulfuromonas sp. TaxID=181013 RepID=UPI002AAAA68F|nr:hypothetical protein [uncultured Desulfuromonas sp.]
MKIIIPTTITETGLVSSTVPEDDYAEWSSATSYSTGDLVMVAALHKIFEANQANSDSYPPDNEADWLDRGATNRWAMFDNKIGTATTADETMSIAIDAGLVTGVALIGMSARSVTITMTDAVDGVVYNKTHLLYDPTLITSWYDYFFEEIEYRRTLVVLGLPSYRGATIEITVDGGVGEQIAVGALVVGRHIVYAEAAKLGSSVGIMDYSVKKTDDFGVMSIVERDWSLRGDFNVVLDNVLLDNFTRRMVSLRSKPAVYIGYSGYDSTIVYGFYKSFDTVMEYPNHTELSIEIEGLTDGN